MATTQEFTHQVSPEMLKEISLEIRDFFEALEEMFPDGIVATEKQLDEFRQAELSARKEYKRTVYDQLFEKILESRLS